MLGRRVQDMERCQAQLVPLLYAPILNDLKLCLCPSKFIEVSRWRSSPRLFKHSYIATRRVKIMPVRGWGVFNSWRTGDFRTRTLCVLCRKVIYIPSDGMPRVWDPLCPHLCLPCVTTPHITITHFSLVSWGQ